MEKITYKNKLLNKLNVSFLWKTTGFKMLNRAEVHLHMNGSFGWDKIHKKWVIGKFDEQLDDNGEFVNYVCHTLSTTDKESYTLKNHEEVIVCGNNLMYKTDTDLIDWFTDMLHETDISIYHQLMNSRNIPIIACDNDKMSEEVKLAFEERKAGVPATIRTNLISKVQTVDITDPSSIDKISTLDNFHEELIKRMCNEFGIDVETKEKKAQVNELELDCFGDYSTLNFLIYEISRKQFVDEMKANGYNIECTRNPVYWDEPTDKDVENGTFEIMQKGDSNNEEKESDSQTVSDSSTQSE